MEAHNIVPDVIDVAPKDVLQATYSNGKIVDQGAELTPTEVKQKPVVTWQADANSYYTLLMTDPDAPSRANPFVGEVRHWLVVNIPGNDITKGETIAEYRGSGAPKGTGLHRYIFLLYKQNGVTAFDEPKVLDSSSREHRLNTSTRKFVEKYKFDAPIAGNFFQAQWDESVPEYVPIPPAKTG